jgi:ubiquinone/menaquinone biosynthesis C-methylase UbiE
MRRKAVVIAAEDTEGWLGWLEERDQEPAGERCTGWLERIADRVVDKARLKPTDMVVDLGVGTGLLAMRAARAVSRGRVVAVDASTGCLEQLQKNCDKISVSNVETIVACLERLPFGS